MPIPATQIVTSGTANTSQLGVGAIAGNAITIAGLTLAPNQPGWSLVSSRGGPGFVEGSWQFGPPMAARGELPVQGAYYRSGAGAGSGGSGDDNGLVENMNIPSVFQLTPLGWALLGLVATIILTGKGR